MKGYLVLEDGSIFEGERFGYKKDTACEVVFNTSMVGYIETFTDPSYAGQGIVMTYPLIGNYGVITSDYESKKIWAKAVIVHDLAEFENNFRTEFNLEKMLKDNRTPGLKNINTRKLTRLLRDNGTMRGYITSSIDDMEFIMNEIKSYKVGSVVDRVTCKEKETFGKSKIKVALLDYGYKRNILNSLLKRGVEVTVFPARTPAEEIIKGKFDGIMLSNGPGDPEDCVEEIDNIKKLFKEDTPIFGICLGHQLMGLANNFKTAKLKYGHRGPNHPVKDLAKDRVYITSQNHGYYILDESVDKDIAEISHINLNDNTVEGLKYKNKKIFTVQFHPEACGGPEDTAYLFDEFIEMIGGSNNA